ncbi:hypothetical protein BC827DRAFT_164504 [Russula dissimulans]|nr:hypothetical protein BC827DRAFT_164504 [Russula dissimulans]
MSIIHRCHLLCTTPSSSILLHRAIAGCHPLPVSPPRSQGIYLDIRHKISSASLKTQTLTNNPCLSTTSPSTTAHKNDNKNASRHLVASPLSRSPTRTLPQLSIFISHPIRTIAFSLFTL